jgi:hypothetical protein
VQCDRAVHETHRWCSDDDWHKGVAVIVGNKGVAVVLGNKGVAVVVGNTGFAVILGNK